MLRISQLCFALLLTYGCGGTQSPPMPAVERINLLVGPEGLEVTIVELKDSALVKVTGGRGPLNRRVTTHKLSPQQNGMNYITQVQGRQWATVLQRQFYSRGNRWDVHLYGSKSIQVERDDNRSRSVDAAAIYREHIKQMKSGELTRIRQFDRSASEAKHNTSFAKETQTITRDCGGTFKSTIDWTTISDEQMLKYSVGAFCANIYTALRHTCESKAMREYMSGIDTVHCSTGNEARVERTGSTLVWQFEFNTGNLGDRATNEFKALTIATGETIKEAVKRENTTVCLGPKGNRAVLLSPSGKHAGVSYGTVSSKRFVHTVAPAYTSSHWFFDPRHYNPKNNPNFRGLDMRYHSELNVNKKNGSCALVCGQQRIPLQLASDDKRDEIMRTATFVPTPFQRRPYALARDRRGTYYYVDRGHSQETQENFNVYIGKPGRLRKQEMKDIISDSEGQIFATKSGRLRLIIGKEKALWIARSKTTLQWVPIRENYRLIYNELGVYTGRQLGLPCDDLY